MIITCEKCDTRFNLDDSRIPADGVKVRCSRCKHAFFVQPGQAPGSSDSEAAEDLAREAMAAAPGRTQTLEESDDHTQMLDHGSVDFSAPSREESDEESDWEFNEEPQEDHSASPLPQRPAPEPTPELAEPTPELAEPSPQLAEPGLDLGGAEPEPAPQPAARQGPPSQAVSDPMNEFLASESPPDEADGLSLDDLGSPEEWDLLGSEGAESAPAPPAPEPEPPRAAPAPAATPAPAKEPDVAFDSPPAAVVEELPLAPAASPRTVQTGMGAVAWAVMAILLALAAWGSLVPDSPVQTHVAPTELGGLRVDGVEAQVVENAVAGPLYVVTGQLHNPGQAPSLAGAHLQVQLLDAGGAALQEPPVPLAPAPSEESLRMDEPELLLARQRQDADVLARTTLAPGESIGVVALLPRLPEEARGFRLELGRRVSSEASPESPPPRSEEATPSPE